MTISVRPSISWSKVICKEPGDYIGWPTIAREADGELLTVFSGDRETHFCPYGKNQMVRSHDGGETWSSPETINSTPLDDRDTGIVVLRSGAIVMSWFTGDTAERMEQNRKPAPDHMVDAWTRHCAKISEEERRRWHGHWTRRSTDGGSTWETAVDSIASAPHGPIQLQDGRLLYMGHPKLEGRPSLVSVESADEGRSWRMMGTIPVPERDAEELPFFEPHPADLPDGRLLWLWRYQPSGSPDDFYMQQTESTDGGKTWSVTHPTPMWGYPPHLILLHNGDVLATYGYRRPRYGQRACLSHDGGLTWDIDNEIILRDDADNGDLGYPASLELQPGEILTVYYQIDEPPEKTSLMATRWSLGI